MTTILSHDFKHILLDGLCERFVYESDNSLISYNPWPDFHMDENECVEVVYNKDKSFWSTAPCEDLKPYICSSDPQPISGSNFGK